MREPSKATAFYLGNTVEVGPDVAIASGAVLEAAPGSRLVLGTGSCIGSGVVIQAYGGDLILAPGVSLGKEVLLVGAGYIGEKACIGAESTLINPQIEADAAIPARSLLDTSFSSSDTPDTTFSNSHSSSSEANGTGNVLSAVVEDPSTGASIEDNDNGEPMSSSPSSEQPVYGRDQVMQLVKTLFPHRDSLNGNNGSS